MDMKKIALIGLSNPVTKEKVDKVKNELITQGYDVYVSDIVSYDVDAKSRACVFNELMKKDFDYICDISGGDLANETIKYLDMDAYKKSKAYFYGYSDLTVVLNALYSKTSKKCCLFQVRNNTNFDNEIFNYDWINPVDMNGVVIGGNIRCLLKLAGTPYFPDCRNKILFLESFSGGINRIRTYFAQLEMMGVLDQISGLILGQFTELDENGDDYILNELVSDINVGVIRTYDIGHSKDSKAIWIGRQLNIEVVNSNHGTK